MRRLIATCLITIATAVGRARAEIDRRRRPMPPPIPSPRPCRQSIWYGCNCDDCRGRRVARRERLLTERLNLVKNIARTESELLQDAVVWVGGLRIERKLGALDRARRLRSTNYRRAAQLRVLDAKLTRDRELWDSNGRMHGNTRASADLARKLSKLGQGG